MSCTKQELESARRWREKNRHKLCAPFRKRDREKERAAGRARYKKNAARYREAAKKYREENADRVREAGRKSYHKRRPVALKEMSAWKKSHRPHINAYHRTKYQQDVQTALQCRLRARLTSMMAVVGTVRADSALRLLGITLPEFKAHLEARFLPGMSWDNRDLWHIDHRRPCASFDLTDKEQQRQCFHFTNLQPLWAADNQSKGAKLIAA